MLRGSPEKIARDRDACKMIRKKARVLHGS